jgi:hypothetical protein
LPRVFTTKEVALLAVPPAGLGVVTVIGPVVAFRGTLTVSCVLVRVLVTVASTPLKNTAAVPKLVKPVPVMVTIVPTPPAKGVKPVMVGGTDVVKAAVTGIAGAQFVATVTPLPAPAGTVATSRVAVVAVAGTRTNSAATFPKLTAVTASRLVPVSVTRVLGRPLVGTTPVRVGAGGALITTVGDAPVAVPTVATAK